MNLYLKYRPRTIEELDLASVRKALSDIVSANKVAHAYLLTGPRGAGKTSTARVLARIVNCERNGEKLGEPCNKCSACLSILDGSAMDVIEIDAASNRGIDDIRELKEKIRLAPAILPKKVYIIDEVHMLTTEAFNALLKTLEEPPKHSLFILCTTELHKVPETIVSRCVQIQFTKATPEEMQRSFNRVVTGEGKEASPEALIYLSTCVDGSFRDGVKILDQVLSNADSISIEAVQLVVSGSATYTVVPLLSALVERDGERALAEFHSAMQSGVDLSYLLLSCMRGLRDALLSQWRVKENPLATPVTSEVTKLIGMLDEVARKLSTSLDGELLVQTLIVEWCGLPEGSAEAKKQESGNSDQSEKKIKVASPKVEQKAEKTEAPVHEVLAHTSTDARDVWKQVLGSLGQNNMALDTILSKARPGNIHGDELTVYVQYDFHKQQLMNEKNLVKFEALISSAVGIPMKVKVEVVASDTIVETPKFEEDLMSQAQEIFNS